MGCCNAKKSDAAELDLQTFDHQSGQLLNNDGVDDLILAGASVRLREENLRKSRNKGLSLEKSDEPAGQLPINTPTFGQIGQRQEPFKFEEKEALKEVTEEHTFGGSPDPNSPSVV